MIVAWPGVTDAGSRSSVPTISMDLFPTILEMADVEIPESHRPTVDGKTLVPFLRTGKEPETERPLFWHMPHQWGARGPGIEPFTSMRLGKWKCYYFHDGPRVELYDLSKDLSETNDVAAANTETVNALLLRMNNWFQQTGAQLSNDTSSGEEIQRPGSFISGRNN
jgi:arylsulfatase A-like enzyme